MTRDYKTRKPLGHANFVKCKSVHLMITLWYEHIFITFEIYSDQKVNFEFK